MISIKRGTEIREYQDWWIYKMNKKSKEMLALVEDTKKNHPNLPLTYMLWVDYEGWQDISEEEFFSAAKSGMNLEDYHMVYCTLEDMAEYLSQRK